MSVAGLLAQVIVSRIRELHWRGEDGELSTPQGSWEKNGLGSPGSSLDHPPTSIKPLPIRTEKPKWLR